MISNRRFREILNGLAESGKIEIVENVSASMSMEGMNLTEEEKDIGLKCLDR